MLVGFSSMCWYEILEYIYNISKVCLYVLRLISFLKYLCITCHLFKLYYMLYFTNIYYVFCSTACYMLYAYKEIEWNWIAKIIVLSKLMRVLGRLCKLNYFIFRFLTLYRYMRLTWTRNYYMSRPARKPTLWTLRKVSTKIS